MVLFGLASLASAYAQDPGQLIVARAFMGIGGAAIMPATLAIISNVFPPRERAKAIGVWAGGVGLAVAIGPITGGLLLEHFWWGSVFLINVPIVVSAWSLIALARARVPGPRARPGSTRSAWCCPSSAWCASSTASSGAATWPRSPRRRCWSHDRCGLAVLARLRLVRAPHRPPGLRRRGSSATRGFATAVGTIGIVFFAMMGVMFFLVFYLQIVRGFSPLQAGRPDDCRSPPRS